MTSCEYTLPCELVRYQEPTREQSVAGVPESLGGTGARLASELEPASGLAAAPPAPAVVASAPTAVLPASVGEVRCSLQESAAPAAQMTRTILPAQSRQIVLRIIPKDRPSGGAAPGVKQRPHFSTIRGPSLMPKRCRGSLMIARSFWSSTASASAV